MWFLSLVWLLFAPVTLAVDNCLHACSVVSVRGAYGGYFKKADRYWYDAERPFLLSIENPGA